MCIKVFFNGPKLNTRGLTLLEVIISISLLAVLIFSFLIWVQTVHSSVGTLNKNEQVDNAFIKSMAAFGNEDKYCEFILKGKTFSPNSPLTLTSIDFHNDSGQNIGNVLTVGMPVQARSDVKTELILLKSVSPLSPLNIVADLEITFSRTPSGASVKETVTRKMPLMVTIDATNTIDTCSASAEAYVVVQNRLCEIQNDGYEHYDIATKGCILNANVQWFVGIDPREVTCPAGWRPAISVLNSHPEAIVCLSETDSTVDVPERTYSSGTVLNDKLPVWNAVMDSTKTKCLFAFPTNISASLYKSKIKCTQVGP